MTDNQFLGYVALLALSGIILLVIAAISTGQSAGARAISGLFGVGFLGYAIYLFFFDVDSVRVFLYAFVVPIVAIFNAVKSRRAKRQQARIAEFAPAQPQEQQPVPPTS
jgi:drug/metabolite transporter (DMT)-like permease